jgi:hypothetical protein
MKESTVTLSDLPADGTVEFTPAIPGQDEPADDAVWALWDEDEKTRTYEGAFALPVWTRPA